MVIGIGIFGFLNKITQRTVDREPLLIGGINENYKPPKFNPKKSITYHKSYDELKEELLYAKIKIPDNDGGHKTIRVIRDKQTLIEIVSEFDKLKATVPTERYPNRLESEFFVLTMWREGRSVSFVILKSNNQFYYEQAHLLKRKMPEKLIELLGFKINNTYINPEEIEWVTMQGGLHITTKVLFQGNAKDKINKIVSLINNGTNKQPSTQEEIGVTHSKARPIYIAIKLKDGSKVNIYPSYKTTSFENGGWSAMPRDDRFVLNFERDEKDEYFTLLSKEVPLYMRKGGWQQDMPTVKPFTVSPIEVKAGEKVTLSGDGWTDKEITLYIEKTHDERYMIAKVKPVFGAWKWEGRLGKKIKTYEDKEVTLVKGQYMFNVIGELGGIGTGVLQID